MELKVMDRKDLAENKVHLEARQFQIGWMEFTVLDRAVIGLEGQEE